MSRVFIIAEAGVNHNGNIDIARQMIDSAVAAGVDAVKFQTFRAEYLAGKSSPKAEYQKNNVMGGESQLGMLQKLELDVDSHRILLDYCRGKNIEFLSSPFDLESVDLLNDLGLETFKIPSGEITNLPYLRKIGSLNKKVIMSTGMANMKEVQDALGILIEAGTQKANITILHCNTEYPTALEDVNLLAMLTLKRELGVETGYSDHTPGIEVPIAAAALGAKVIEKHFTLDRNMEGPDHKASLEPEQLESMVKAVRKVEKALGHGIKQPSKSEIKNRTSIRKSIVASRNISKGEVFAEENITAKRPAVALSPLEWDNVVGKVSKRSFKKDEAIEL